MTTSMSSDTGSPGSGQSSGPSSEIPEGISPDARETWPSKELIDSFLGTGFDFELRLGEHTPIPTDDPEAAEQARRFRDVLGLFCTGVVPMIKRCGEAELSAFRCRNTLNDASPASTVITAF